MNKTRPSRLIIPALLLSLVCIITSNARVSGFETNGGVPGQCTGWVNDHSYKYTNGTCAPDGMGWMWFQYSDKYYKKGNAPNITFGPGTAYMDAPVPGAECSKYGGFYHFGIFEYKELFGVTSLRGMNFTKFTYNGYGSAGNWGIGYFQSDAIYFDKYTEKLNGNLNHVFYDGSGDVIAKAIRWDDIDTVYQRYQTYKKKTGSASNWSYYRDGSGKPVNSGNLTAFCWDKSMEEDDATFNGKTTIKVDGVQVSSGTSKSVASGTATVTFTHTVSRNNDGPGKALTNHYYTTVTDSYGTPLAKTSSKFLQGQSQTVKTNRFVVNVPYAGGVTVCQTLYYDKKVKDTDAAVLETSNTGNNCVKLTRPAGGDFTAKQSCTVHAAGQYKGNECGKTYETNSQNWQIQHQSWIQGNSGGTVYSGKVGTSNSSYAHGNLSYGTSASCQHSDRPYTYFWYSGSYNTEGATLKGTSRLDLPGNVAADLDGKTNNKYKTKNAWDESKTKTVCKNVGAGNGSYSDSNCKTSKSGGSYKNVTENYTVHHPAEYKYHYPGCEDGKTYWQTYDEKRQNENWHKDNDPNLLLGNGTNDYVEMPSKCSTIRAKSSYSSGSWSNSETSSLACNTIRRYRRHAHFRQGTTTFKADTDKDNNKNVATTSRSNGYDLDVTKYNGRFIVTLSYVLDRTTTDNVKDTGAENFPVKNEWYSKETIEPADGSGQIYKVNHEKVDGASYGAYGVYRSEGEFPSTKANTNNVAGPKTHTISGMLYYGQKIKICGVLKYGDKVRELDYNGSEIEHWTESTTNCITIHRDTKSCDNIPATATNPSTVDRVLNHQKGDNIAIIGAENITIGISSPYYTVWSEGQGRTDTAAPNARGLWARPGDNIRYTVDYCMGANYAHIVHLADDRPISNSRDTTLKMAGDSTARRTEDTEKVNPIRRSHYLFGDSVSSLTGDASTNKTLATTFNFSKKSNGTFDPSIATNDANFIGEKKSPSDSANTRYSCQNGGGTRVTDDYYQIAGKVRNSTGENHAGASNDRNGNGTDDNYSIDGCDTNRTQSLDVGRELSESLFWTNIHMTTEGGVTKVRNRADYYSKAFVRVPYNYTAKPYLKNNSKPTGTVQIGGKMMTTPGIAVFPRKNCAFLSGFNEGQYQRPEACTANNSYATYATVTKPTTVTFTSYYVDNGGTSHTFKNESIVVRSNTKSHLSGSSAGGVYTTGRGNEGGPQLDDDYIVDIPNNVEPGNRVCIRMTITPADSHNYLGTNPVMGASIKYAASEDTTTSNKTFWALREDGSTSATAISCSTAVKRPTVSVEDSNLYSATQTVTSIVTRKVGTDASTGEGIYRLFGSWSEYGLFSKVMTGTNTDSVSSLGTASGASYGYRQSGYGHTINATGYNAQPLTVVTYINGPKNGTFKYNYKSITTAASQYNIVYKWTTKDDGTHEYKLQSKGSKTIQPSMYHFANSPVVNSVDLEGSAPSNTKVCNHATQTFANVNCDSGAGGIIGSDKVGADAAKTFYDSIIDRYGNDKMAITKTDGATRIGSYINLTETKAVAEQFDDTNDENSALYKNLGTNKGFLGYANGADINLANLSIKSNGSAEGIDLGLTAKSVIVYKADTIVINSSILANTDEKTGPDDFRMPIIIANKVWFTGTPKRIDAIIIAKEELNTCKWSNYSNFVNNVQVKFPRELKDTNGNFIKWSNTTDEMSSDLCSNELRFTAPVIVKGKLILNRTSGAGAGGDQIRRAELFELNPATYLWSFHEMSRYSQATTTYSRELPTRY